MTTSIIVISGYALAVASVLLQAVANIIIIRYFWGRK